MMEETEKVLKLLEVLSNLSIKFKVVNGDTIYLIGLDEKTQELLDAVLDSQPDENGMEEEGYRLWWD